MAWMKLLGNYRTEEEALSQAMKYAKEPYVKDFYVEKARKYWHIIVEIDFYALKHGDGDFEDNPFR